MTESDIKAAIQAASMASNYMLAIELTVRYELTMYCIGCMGTSGPASTKWRFRWPTSTDDLATWSQEILTCDACVEHFTLWASKHVPECFSLGLVTVWG